MKTSRIFGAVFAVLLSVSVANTAHAVRLGPLEAHPNLGFNTTYDDNVYVQNTNEKSDWYFTVSPGMLLRLPVRKSVVEVEYKADIFRYVDTGDNNNVEDHYLRGLIGVNLASGVSLRLDDLGTRGHEARGDTNAAVVGATPMNKYYKNDFMAELGYDISERFKVTAAYTNFYMDYDLDANSFRDRMDNGGDLTVYYKFMPKTSVLVEGTYKDVNHREDSDNAKRLNSVEYNALAGLTWDITAKSKGTVKAGYGWKDFDEGDRKDFSSPVFNASLEHHFTPKTSMFISGSRFANETDDPNVEYMTGTRGQLKLRFNPVTKVFVSPYTSISNNEYSGDTTVQGDTGRREDDIYSSGIDASYNMNKWIAFHLGYKYTHRVSTFTYYDYTDNSVTFGFKGTL
ncbi:MAG: outer membrane beta-barrel protein [Nitrospirae bacterium]|nr:outer membrane beta-barrel protein [Nitrospirota bacterium]MBI5696168.1 outer membrane beta-barrel protein [Nitrospirota bacterium]